MASKHSLTYVRHFQLCNKDHFLIVQGISVLAGLIAYYAMEIFKTPDLSPIIGAAMAVFLLCSGFGVSESYLLKRGLIHFWENKMIKTWLPSLVTLMILATIEYRVPIAWISKHPVALKGNLMYLIFGEYVVFWLLFKFVKNRMARVLCLFGCSVIAFAVIPESMDIKPLLFCFPIGVMFSQKGWKRSVREYTWKGKALLLFACAAIAVGSWFLGMWLKVPYIETLVRSVFCISSAATLIFGVWIAQPVPIFGVFVPFGMGAYMIYLLYDKVYELFLKSTDWRIHILMFAVLFVAAGVLTWARELLILWNKNLRRRSTTRLKGSM